MVSDHYLQRLLSISLQTWHTDLLGGCSELIWFWPDFGPMVAKMVVSDHYLEKLSSISIQTWCTDLFGEFSELIRFWPTSGQFWPSGGQNFLWVGGFGPLSAEVMKHFSSNLVWILIRWVIRTDSILTNIGPILALWHLFHPDCAWKQFSKQNLAGLWAVIPFCQCWECPSANFRHLYLVKSFS